MVKSPVVDLTFQELLFEKKQTKTKIPKKQPPSFEEVS